MDKYFIFTKHTFKLLGNLNFYQFEPQLVTIPYLKDETNQEPMKNIKYPFLKENKLH